MRKGDRIPYTAGPVTVIYEVTEVLEDGNVTGKVVSVDVPKQLEIIDGEANDGKGDGWSREWPTAPGWYWFYGYASRYDERDGYRIMKPVEAWETAKPGEFAYVAGARFIYRCEGAAGWWHPMTVPALPAEETHE